MAGARDGRGSALELFREGPFRYLFIIRFSSNIASHMLSVVVGWQIYDLTGSALHLGMIGLVQLVPHIALTLFAGQVADRYDRRVVLRICYLIQAIAPMGFLVLSNLTAPPLFMFYLLLFIAALARTFESPSLQAILPTMVSRDILGRAIALSTSAQKMSMLLGPTLGGLIYMASASADYASCLVMIALAAWSSFMLPEPRFGERSVRDRSWGTVFSGLRMIAKAPVIFGLMTLDLLAVLFGGVVALLPIFAKDVLEIGPFGLGILRSSPAVGALLMAVVLSRHPVKRGAGRLVFAGVATYGVGTLVFGLSENVALSVAALLVVGAGDMLGQVLRQTIIQLRTPDSMRGRVGAVSSLSVTVGGQLGQFESGVTAAWFGVVGSVLLGGFAVLAIVAVWMWKFPTLREIQDPEEEAPPVTRPSPIAAAAPTATPPGT